MFGKIINIAEKSIKVSLLENNEIKPEIMSMPLVIEDNNKKLLGEVVECNKDEVTIRLLGEIINNNFVGGILRKPNPDAKIRVLEETELPLIVGENKYGYINMGTSPFYRDKIVYSSMNDLFSNHMAIFGNTGSGKSCGVARLLQNVFYIPNFIPYRSNFIIFDSTGEYNASFSRINEINPNYNYRFITTNENSPYKGDLLKIPLWLLGVNDLALILAANTHTQISIIEKTLKLANIFAQSDEISEKYKNHLIAIAILTVLYSNQGTSSKRDEIFSILNSCPTDFFNMNAVVHGIGYTRKLHECFLIDSTDQFSERVLLTEYINKYLSPELSTYEPKQKRLFNLQDLEKSLNFALISEGWLRNNNVYADAISLKVKLHELVIGPNAKFFDYKEFCKLDQFLSNLIIKDGKKYQILNINLEDIDDAFAKAIVKIFTNLIFDFSKKIERGSVPFNLFLEEAHRYVQKDDDEKLFGYNIFDRVSKEGRKYGIILNLISQRPVDLSETVLSQCSNFIIFKMSHPRDIEYITKMIPNITDEIIEKQKSLQIGNCLIFGNAFKIPMILKVEMPTPAPQSSNCNVVGKWTNIEK